MEHDPSWTVFLIKNDGTKVPLVYVVPDKNKGDDRDVRNQTAGVMEEKDR